MESSHPSSEKEAGAAPLLASAALSSTWDGFVEAIWETMFVVATATAVCVGLASLAARVDEAQAARNAGIASSQQVDVGSSARLSSDVTPIDSHGASQLD
jgi:hypothetical protein